MCRTPSTPHRGLSAILFAILVTTIAGASSHHHSPAEHHRLRDQERIQHEHQQRHRQSLEGQMHHAPHQFSNKSSKFVVINSNPAHQYRPNEMAFRGWYHFLTRPTAVATTTPTTTTTTTTTTAAPPKTPYPSLWNYAPKSHQRNNSIVTRSGLSPRQGRHVCVENRSATTTILQPVKSNSFGSPSSSHCNGNQICDDLRQRRKQITYKCCLGWEQMYKHSKGCNRAICDRGCRNGGRCVRPNVCQCPAGWTGEQCQEDINECANKPCDQSCINSPGSFTCACRSGFHLQEDRTSCKSQDSNHVALETSELNGEDIDFDEIDHRLKKLERSLGPDNNHHIMNKHLDRLLNRVNQLEQYQYSNEIRLKAMEAQAKKADGLIEHLFRCRQYPNFCN